MVDSRPLDSVRSAPVPEARIRTVSGLMARAARLHYEFGLTHQDTAEALGISRVKVTRLLKQARQAGIVKIMVVSDVSPFAELEDRLADRTGLREVVIVPGASSSGVTRSMLARGAASYLHGRVVADSQRHRLHRTVVHRDHLRQQHDS